MSKLLEILAEGIHEKSLGKVFIIAEIANAHQGDPTTAELLVASTAKARADAVKFQI